MPKRTEKEEIKKDGAQGVKNSGRGMMKGDAKLGKFLVDYKHNGKTFTSYEKELDIVAELAAERDAIMATIDSPR